METLKRKTKKFKGQIIVTKRIFSESTSQMLFFMTEALVGIMNPKLSQQKRIYIFMKSKTLCDSAYGEFFIMISRIYHRLNGFFGFFLQMILLC